MDVRRTVVYARPGEFAGWPANYGMWAWGQEVLAMFAVGTLGAQEGLHARDKSRPFRPVLARSTDGGVTWTHEQFTGARPVETLNGDEHVAPGLRAAEHLSEVAFAPPPAPLRFDDPETLVLCARTGLSAGATSWFYASHDRGHNWSGPHVLPGFGVPGVAARTDVVALAGASALFMLTVAKANGHEGHVQCVRTDDGGRTFQPVSFVGPEPAGWAIMPSSTLLPDGAIVTALRCQDRAGGGVRHRIDVRRSVDEGTTWSEAAVAVVDTGAGGNPPALVQLHDGRLVIVYGQRRPPFGMRYVVSRDDGRNWSDPTTLTGDDGIADLGYPRAVPLPGADVLAVRYANRGADTPRTIEALLFTP